MAALSGSDVPHRPTSTPAAPSVSLVFHVGGALEAVCADRAAAEAYVLNTYDPNTFDIREVPLLDADLAGQAGLTQLRRALLQVVPQVLPRVTDSPGPAAVEDKVREVWHERTNTDWADYWAGHQPTPPPIDIDLVALGCDLQRDYLREAEWIQHAGTRTGWLASDGGYSVELPDSRMVWICADTFVASNIAAAEPESTPRLGASVMVHNSFVLDDRSTRTTITGTTVDRGLPTDVIPAPSPDEHGRNRWYWPGAGLVSADGTELLVFAHRQIATGTGPFDFAFDGTALARFSLPDLGLIDVVDVHPGPIRWGAAVARHGEHILVYGVEDLGADKSLHLARVRADELVGHGDPATGWEYRQGEDWSPAAADSTRLLHGVANEFGVLAPSPRLGGWTLITHDTRTPFSPDIVSYQAEQPWGPWTGPTLVYRTPETSDQVYTYNAKPHPSVWSGRSGDIQVSYCVNNYNPDQLDLATYRWRWLRVPMEMLASDPSSPSAQA